LFAIELDGPTWDFGSLTFSNIVITSSGTETSWCNDSPSNYNSATNFTIAGVEPVVNGESVECRIEELIMVGPAAA